MPTKRSFSWYLDWPGRLMLTIVKSVDAAFKQQAYYMPLMLLQPVLRNTIYQPTTKRLCLKKALDKRR